MIPLPQPNVLFSFEQKIESSLSPTENTNEENNHFEDMSENIYDRLQNWPLQGHDWYVVYREYYEYSLTNFSKQYYE